MTVQSTTSRISYAGNGVTLGFAVPFRFLANTHLLVVLRAADGTATTQVLTTNYTVTGARSQSGGAVGMLVAPPAGTTLVITRNVPLTQLIDYKANDPFPEESAEDGLDQLTMALQQQGGTLGRALVLFDTDTDGSGRYNANGNRIVDLADGVDPTDAATLQQVTALGSGNFIQSGTGAVVRTMQNKAREALSVADFLATGDGVTDDTATIQSAINEAAATGRALRFGPGTFIVTGLVGASNIELVGEGIGRTIVKRKASAAGNAAVIDFTSKTGFALRGITFDGNKAAQVNASQSCTLSACSAFVVAECAFINAKAVSGGFGTGLAIVNCSTANKLSRVVGCQFTANDQDGLLARQSLGLDISSNIASSNGAGGIALTDYTFPPITNAQTQITVSGNHCHSNTGSGIGAAGYYTGGSLSAPVYGPSFESSYITITGNVCSANSVYGIAFQGALGAVTGNSCFANTGAGFSAGILFNGLASSCVGNSCYNNEVYGIDAGGSYHSVVNGNSCFANGEVGINLGGSVDCVCSGNQVVLTGSDVDIGITVPGLDGDGGTPFPTVGNGTVIEGNKIVLNSNSGSLGISVGRDYSFATVTNNVVAGATAAHQAFAFEVSRIAHSGNVDAYLIAVSGINAVVMASAATLIIPDHADMVFVSGTTGITNLRTKAQDFWFQKVRDVRITAQGSGYVRATPPTVNFAGGGGAGAAATVEIDNGGRIVGVTMTNNGSGYTSAPTVTFTGGTGGSGAAGTALVGCANANGRTIQLFFQGALTVTDGGNLILAGNLVTTANGASLRLLGAYDSYYELGRSSGL